MPAQAVSHAWDVGKGPDPFAAPPAPLPEHSSTPLRRMLDLDTPFLGHYQPVRVHPPRRIQTSPEPNMRMTGFLIGNGVYAVLESSEGAVVVNPGDHVGDRIVSDIRPNETRLTSNGNVYTVSLRQSP